MATPRAAVTFAAFTTALNAIPYSPRQAQAKGIIAPLIRSSGHILFLTACLSAMAVPEAAAIMTEEEAIDELRQASAHVDPANIPRTIEFSTRGAELLAVYTGAINTAVAGYHDWTAADRLTACRNLSNRAAALGAFLDREFTGIPEAESDPGSSF